MKLATRLIVEEALHEGNEDQPDRANVYFVR